MEGDPGAGARRARELRRKHRRETRERAGSRRCGARSSAPLTRSQSTKQPPRLARGGAACGREGERSRPHAWTESLPSRRWEEGAPLQRQARKPRSEARHRPTVIEQGQSEGEGAATTSTAPQSSVTAGGSAAPSSPDASVLGGVGRSCRKSAVERFCPACLFPVTTGHHAISLPTPKPRLAGPRLPAQRPASRRSGPPSPSWGSLPGPSIRGSLPGPPPAPSRGRLWRAPGKAAHCPPPHSSGTCEGRVALCPAWQRIPGALVHPALSPRTLHRYTHGHL